MIHFRQGDDSPFIKNVAVVCYSLISLAPKRGGPGYVSISVQYLLVLLLPILIRQICYDIEFDPHFAKKWCLLFFF